jgi:hypothetical protein
MNLLPEQKEIVLGRNIQKGLWKFIFNFMQMSKSLQYKILDIVDEIKKLDKMIKLHQLENNTFMAEQYLAKETKVIKELFELISPAINNTDSILFIKLLLNKFYSDLPHFNDKKVKEKSSIDFELLQKEI